MKLTEINASYSRTVNLGNMQSAKVGISLVASVDDGEDEGKAIDHLKTLARDAVHEELLRLPRAVEGPGVARTGPSSPAPVSRGNGPQTAPQTPVVAPAGPPFQPGGTKPEF